MGEGTAWDAGWSQKPCISSLQCVLSGKRRVRLYHQAEPRETVFLSTASTLQIHWPNSAQHTTLRNLGYRAEQKTQGLRPRFGFDTVPGAACSLQPVPEGSIEGALWPPTMGYRCAHPIRKHQLLSSED